MKAALGAFAAAGLFLAGVVVGLGSDGGGQAAAPEAIALVDTADSGGGQAGQEDRKGSRPDDVKSVPRDVTWGEYDDDGGGYQPNDADTSGPDGGGSGSGSGDGTATGDATDGDGDSSGPGGGGGDNSGPGSDNSGPGSTDSGSGSSGSGSSGSGSSGSGSSGSGSSGSG